MGNRKVLYALFFLLVTISFTGCEGFGNCKICRLNLIENGSVIGSLNEAEYCDTELIAVQATPNEVVNGVTHSWECD
jgi:hypothetical protein